MDQDSEDKLIVLFDEYGTPTFNSSSNQGIFLGVAALYKSKAEYNIFNDCDKLIGLSKSKALKNDKITVEKALEIAEEIGEHDLTLVCGFISLKNDGLRETSETYSEFASLSRLIFRGIKKERKIAHILHSHIVEYCLFDVMSRHVLNHQADSYTFECYLDDWSYPTPDQYIVLKYASESVEKKLQGLISDNGRESKVHIKPKELLKGSSQRKRFIDVLTSIVSRAFMDKNDPKYDAGPLKALKSKLGSNFRINDYTSELIEFMTNFMIETIQETKTKDKEIIIKHL